MKNQTQQQPKLNDYDIGEMRSMTKRRWPNTDFDETFARWNRENEARSEV